jgi:hypothetical protein
MNNRLFQWLLMAAVVLGLFEKISLTQVLIRLTFG